MKSTICSGLRKFRVENGKTQREMAEVLGIRINSYQRYEYEMLELPVRHAKKLGEYFKFDWWLLYESERY